MQGARKALGQYLASKGDKKAARTIRERAKPKHHRWTKGKIARALLKIHEQGGRITSEHLKKHPDIKEAIYYKDEHGEPVYYSGMAEARAAVAALLEKKGDSTAHSPGLTGKTAVLS